MSSRQGSSRNPGRMIRIENFQIYTGPCKSCPPGVEPWIRQFCRLNSWYVPIDNDWAGDWFNQYGIGNNFDSGHFKRNATPFFSGHKYESNVISSTPCASSDA